MSKLIILHIITGLGTGGAERALNRLVQASDKTYYKHYVVSLTNRGTQGDSLEQAGVKVFFLGIKNVFGFPKAAIRIRNIRKVIKPDIIHGWMYHGGLMALWAGSDAPKILGVRHSLHDLKKEKRLTRTIIRILAKQSRQFSAIVYNSENSRIQHEAVGYASEKASVLPNGFDCEEFAPDSSKRDQIRKTLALGKDETVFGHIARYHPMKNHHGLIEAFAMLNKSHPSSRLMLIGWHVSKENTRLSEYIKRLKLEEKILLLDEQSDIPSFLNAMDWLVSSSLWGEGFPNVIGEAMACEVPCIATDVGDSAYIIDENGFIVDPDNTRALAEAMTRAAQLSPEEKAKLGKSARKRVKAEFQHNAIARKYETLYQEIAK